MIDQNVSIIVPAYNAGSTIERCLESILNQDYPCLDVIVVNDGSTDDTLQKALEYPVKIISNTNNSGAGYSRNIGVKNASSNIIIFIDSDIVLPCDAVSRAITTHLEQPEPLMIIGVYSENSKHLNFISDYKNLDLVYRSSLNPEYIKITSTAFCLITMTTFLKAGGFSTDFPGSSVEDLEFGARVCDGECRTFLDRNIKVDHLKTYNLFSLLKTNFMRMLNMFKIRKTSNGKIKAGEDISLTYPINILLAGLIVLSVVGVVFAFELYYVILFLICIFILNNIGFMRFLVGKRGGVFALKSLFLLFIEYVGVGCSILISLIIYIPKRSK